MLKRSLLIGSLTLVLFFAALWGGAHAQSGLSAGHPTTSLNEVKQAILAATAAVAGVIAEMPEFKGIQAIHIDYFSRMPDGSASRSISAKTPIASSGTT